MNMFTDDNDDYDEDDGDDDGDGDDDDDGDGDGDGDDGDDDGGDDDDVEVEVDVERTRTGPYAVRSDVEHQVNHNASISSVYHVFSSYKKKAGQQAGKSMCLAIKLLLVIIGI